MSEPQESCTHIPSCELYKQFELEASVAVWKILYCCNDYQRCARYKLASKGEIVPLKLLPNGEMLDV